jgi:hypothetical protein
VRAVVYDRYGPPEVLRIEEVERPAPADDEVERRRGGPYEGPLFRGLFFILMGHGAHALGVARCAIDAFVEVVHAAQARPVRGSSRQARLGQQQAPPDRGRQGGVTGPVGPPLRLGRRRPGLEPGAGRPADRADAPGADGAVPHPLGALGQGGGGPPLRAGRHQRRLPGPDAGALLSGHRDAAQHTLVVETSYDTIGQHYLTRNLLGGPQVGPGVVMPAAEGRPRR